MTWDNVVYVEIRSFDGKWARAVMEDGSAFVVEVAAIPPGVEIRPYAPAPEPTPTSLTQRQLRLWLVRHGYTLAQVDALIDALPAAEREEARIEWEHATEFRSSSPLFRRLAGALLRAEGDDLDALLDEAFSEASRY